jgi:hypothetical protein
MMSEQTAGSAVADRDQAQPVPDKPAPKGVRRWIRSPAALITLAAVVGAAGLFVGGIALGRSTTQSTQPGSGSPSGLGTATTAAGGGCGSGASGQCIAFTSAATDSVRVGTPFTFRITTSGPAGTRIRKTGRSPKGVHFINNHDGTATLAGTVVRAHRQAATSYALTFTAVIGSGATRQAVHQNFVLNVLD